MANDALLRAIGILGSQRAVAEVVGVKQPSIHERLKSGSPLPLDWCVLIERATKGKVKRHELRPDFPWTEIRRTA